MSNEKSYWQSTHKDISVQTKNVLNEYLLSLKLANKAEATITKYRWVLELFLVSVQSRL